MRVRTGLLCALAAAVVAGGAAITVWACGGTPRPPCPRTLVVPKAAPGVIVSLAPAPTPIPVFVAPILTWNPDPLNCAQPSGGTITFTFTFTFTFTPVGGTAATVETSGPIALPIPTVPGVQPIPTGLAPGAPVALGGPYLYPGVVLPAGGYFVAVVADVTYDFGAGAQGGTTGSGPISAAGDIEVCLVDPAPGQPGVPRLDLQLLEPLAIEGLTPFTCGRRGDQITRYWKIDNNDPAEDVTVEFSAKSNNISRMPTGNDPDGTFFSPSLNIPGTDGFPLQLLVPGGQGKLTLPDPEIVDDNEITFGITVPAGGTTVFGLESRSNGMCAPPTCCEVVIRGTGTFTDSTLEPACVSFSHIVDDSKAPVSPAFELTDDVKTDANSDTQWSPVVFDGDPHLSTHAGSERNVFPDLQGPGGVQTTGTQVAEDLGIFGFPPQSQSILRTDAPPNEGQYRVDRFERVGSGPTAVFFQTGNALTVSNIGSSGIDGVEFPVVRRNANPQDELAIEVDLADPSGPAVIITDPRGGPAPIFDGTLQQLQGDPDFDFDPQTCRRLSFDFGQLSAPWLGTDVPTLGGFVDSVPTTLDIIDRRTGMAELPFSISSNHPAIRVSTASSPTPAATATGLAGEPVTFTYDATQLPLPVPNDGSITEPTTVVWLDIQSPDALNSPLHLPITLRPPLGPEKTDLTWKKLSLKRKIGSTKPKDTVSFTFTFPVPPDAAKSARAGAEFMFAIGDPLDPTTGFVYTGTTDAKGKAKSADKTMSAKLAINTKKDLATMTVTGKKLMLMQLDPLGIGLEPDRTLPPLIRLPGETKKGSVMLGVCVELLLPPLSPPLELHLQALIVSPVKAKGSNVIVKAKPPKN